MSHGVVAHNGYVWTVAGYRASQNVSLVMRFDGVNWTTMNNFPIAVRSTWAVDLNGTMYAGSGYTSTSITNVYKYVDASDSWTQVAGLPEDGFGVPIGVLGNQIYAVGGGLSSSSYYPSTKVYRYPKNP